jgi:phage recombination protein Bet
MNETTSLQTSNSLISRMAVRFGVEPTKMMGTIKATAFRGDVTNEQMMALLIIADQYQLNPFTREIYAFPDRKAGGIVPVIGVDGWMRIINGHPQMDGVEFDESTPDQITCTIHRKDRSHPIRVTEYAEECRRNTEPWQSHPRRMLRHKALIQCARLAFGFGAIYDPDEADRIMEARQSEIVQAVAELPPEATKPTPIESVKAKLRSRKATPEPVAPLPWWTSTVAYGVKQGLDEGTVFDVLNEMGLTPLKDPGDSRRMDALNALMSLGKQQAAPVQATIGIDAAEPVQAPPAAFPSKAEDLLKLVGTANDWLAKLKPLVLGSSQAGNRRAVSMWKHMDEDLAFSEQATPSMESLQEVCDAVNTAIKEG